MKKLIPAAVAAAAALAAHAETNETESAAAELPRVVVEASRTGKTPAEIPAAVQVVSRAEIAASGARDLADLLQKKSATLDFAHLGANNPALTQLAPRGYGENGFGRLLVMVDGERLNSPDMNAPNLSQISLGSIERIEILEQRKLARSIPSYNVDIHSVQVGIVAKVTNGRLRRLDGDDIGPRQRKRNRKRAAARIEVGDGCPVEIAEPSEHEIDELASLCGIHLEKGGCLRRI